MNDRFSSDAAASMPDGERRRRPAETAAETGLPSTETEQWRYSPIGELDFDALSPVIEAPATTDVDSYGEVVTDRAATVTILDGWVTEIDLAPGWAAKGLEIGLDRHPAPVTDAGEETMFDLLHRAFSPGAVRITVPTGLSVREPIVIVNHQTATNLATFPHVIVTAGDGSDVAVVERQTSVEGYGLSVPLVELRAEPAARLRYESVQELDRRWWQLGRLRSSAAGQATLVCGIAAFGARYARLRADSRLIGRGATGNLVAAYYGDDDQVHDFRVFQHHDARDTRCDLLFKGAQDDASGSIYTGMIHIHPDGAGTNAFQTNRNIKLSPDAWAWSVPNLEIENNDVHCSHASTVSPVDEDQQFYLQARGVPPGVADRLIVAGFFGEVIERLPVEATRDAVRRLVTAKLDRRDAS